jgi:vacuolar-type H+-ATPase subunit F/Vma7
MSEIVAIGERARVRGFGLAGVDVLAADDPDAARAAWRGLPRDVALVILTSAAHAALPAAELDADRRRLWVVMPE